MGVRGYFLLTSLQICNPAVKLCQSQLIRQQFTLPTPSWLLPPNHVSFANVQPRYQFRERPPCYRSWKPGFYPCISKHTTPCTGAIMSTDTFSTLGLQRRSRTPSNGFLCNKLGLVTRIHDLCTLLPCVHIIKPGKESNTAEKEKQECWGRGNGGRFLPTRTWALASSKSALGLGSDSQLIQHPSWANWELGGNNTLSLPWTSHSCVNFKLRELFHMSYQKRRIFISLKGWKKHLAYRQKPASLLGYSPHFSPWSTSHQIRCLPETQRQTLHLISRERTNLNTTNKPGKHIYCTSPKTSTRRHKPTGKILSCHLPSGPRGVTQVDPATLSFTSVGHCHTHTQRILSNVNSTATDWRSVFAQLDLRASPKKAWPGALPIISCNLCTSNLKEQG